MLTITGELTRDYLDGRCNDPLQRRLLMLPWQPDDMTHLSYEQHEDDEIFTAVCTVSLEIVVCNCISVISVDDA